MVRPRRVRGIQIERPVLPERDIHFLGFFLDALSPRKPLTAFLP
jgi:hypothetical protein